MKTFAKNITTTFLTQIVILLIGIGTSVVLARSLGPEGKGLYTLAILLPTLVITITNLGIAPATTYFTAKGGYDPKSIFTNNTFISLLIGGLSVIVGYLIISFFGDSLLPGLPKSIALLGLLLIPFRLVGENIKNILLGLQKIALVNLINLSRFVIIFILISTTLLVLDKGLVETIIALIISWVLITALTFSTVLKSLKGFSHKLDPGYLKSTTTYGLKAHLGNILGFLNYRLDLFLVNILINPLAVGLYSISVGIAEQLWLLSKASSEILLPKIASEKNEDKRRQLTPIISRNVLWITLTGGVILFFAIEGIIDFLYSKEFSSAVVPLQILLIGIVARSSSRVLANDIAARGMPEKNSILSLFALIINITLNLIWIPKFGIAGAAWATTVSYTLTFIGRTIIYSHISKNNFIQILIPQKSDLILYKKFGELFAKKAGKIKF